MGFDFDVSADDKQFVVKIDEQVFLFKCTFHKDEVK